MELRGSCCGVSREGVTVRDEVEESRQERDEGDSD